MKLYINLITRVNIKEGEGLIFKNYNNNKRAFKVLLEKQIVERGDKINTK